MFPGTTSVYTKLHLVDLAGRENERTTLATGIRLVELSFINKSLFHLAGCIHGLAASQKAKVRRKENVQFRNSRFLAGQ